VPLPDTRFKPILISAREDGLVPAPPGPRPPAFEWPRIMDDVFPTSPDCGQAYPLIFSELVKWDGDPARIDRVKPPYEQRLLYRAREEARRYCLNLGSEGCRGMEELEHQVVMNYFRAGTQGMIHPTLIFWFRCTTDAPKPGRPHDDPVPFYWPPRAEPQEAPLCNGDYQFQLHCVSQLTQDCTHPDVAIMKQNNEARLLAEARRAARRFCGQAFEEMCQTPVEQSYGVAHQCYQSGVLGAPCLVSSIMYLFGCPFTT
jgi:hypothetical protein